MVVADTAVPAADLREDHGAGRDARAAEDAGKDARGEAEAQPRVATLALLAGALGGLGTADGIGTDARFRRPGGIASDGAGNLFVTDNYSIRKIVIATAAVSTIAGSSRSPGYDDGTAAARFHEPDAIAWDGAGYWGRGVRRS